jgi:hypothetical protein
VREAIQESLGSIRRHTSLTLVTILRRNRFQFSIDDGNALQAPLEGQYVPGKEGPLFPRTPLGSITFRIFLSHQFKEEHQSCCQFGVSL